MPKYLQNHTIKTDAFHSSIDQAFKIGQTFKPHYQTLTAVFRNITLRKPLTQHISHR